MKRGIGVSCLVCFIGYSINVCAQQYQSRYKQNNEDDQTSPKPYYESKMPPPDLRTTVPPVDWGAVTAQGARTANEISESRLRQSESVLRQEMMMQSIIQQKQQAEAARMQQLIEAAQAVKAQQMREANQPSVQAYYQTKLKDLEHDTQVSDAKDRQSEPSDALRSVELDLIKRWRDQGMNQEAARVIEMPYAPGNAMGLLEQINDDYGAAQNAPEIKEVIVSLRSFIRESIASNEKIIYAVSNGYGTNTEVLVTKEMERLVSETDPQYRQAAKQEIPQELERARRTREFDERKDALKTLSPDSGNVPK